MEDRGQSSANDLPPLIAAVLDKNFLRVKQLVKIGHSLNAKDKNGATALYWACCRGLTEISEFLLNAGSDMNASVKWGTTPLQAAVDNNQEACVRQLLATNADVNAANNRGDTPLHTAAYRGFVNILCLLMEAKANPYLRNSTSMTPLQEAQAQQQVECARLLQQYMDVQPGPPGSIYLSSPNLASSSSSLQRSMNESCKSWPCVPSSSISQSSQEPKRGTNYSPPISNMKHNLIMGNIYPNLKTNETPAIETYGCSELSKSTMSHNGSSGQETCSHEHPVRDSLGLNSSSLPLLSAERWNEIRSLDSKTVQNGSKPGNEVTNHSYSRLPSSFPNTFVHGIATPDLIREVDVPRTDFNENGTQRLVPHAAGLVTREPTHVSPDFTKREMLDSNSKPTFLVNLMSPANEKRFSQSGKEIDVFTAFPDKFNFKHLQQFENRLLEMQTKQTQSDSLIAQLRNKLQGVLQENENLRKENTYLQRLLLEYEPVSLRARGAADVVNESTFNPYLPEVFQSVKHSAEREDLTVRSRCAVENSENESE